MVRSAPRPVGEKGVLTNRKKHRELQAVARKATMFLTGKTNDWKISLNKAEAELIKLEKELGDNEKILKDSKNATEDNSKSLKKFGDSANDAGQKTLKLGDLIKANLISEAIIGGIKSLGSAIMDVARKFGEFVSNGIKNASDLQESQNVVDVTFGESAKTINDWSRKAPGSTWRHFASAVFIFT